MKSLQIRIPDDLLKQVDDFISKGFFRSRSHILREALTNYISEFNYTGAVPYIVGPFTPEEFEKLKEDPKIPLNISNSELKKLKKELESVTG